MGIEKAYGFLMDLILVFILSGLLLAVIKRGLLESGRNEEDYKVKKNR